MTELIKQLPNLIMYIVVGYVFMSIYYFVALKQKSTNIDHILTSSLVIGYIYYNLICLIPFSISYYIDNFLIILSAAIVSYIIARIISNKRIIYILDKLKIRDTGNLYIWDDLIDEDYPMKITITFDNDIYEGIAHYIENYSNSPHIALGAYMVKDKDGNILHDYSEQNSKISIIDISSAKIVEIEYDEKSMECKDIDSLVQYRSNKRISKKNIA